MPDLALDDLRVLYERNPDRINVLIAFADALERFERLEEAEHVLREASAKRPLKRVINWRKVMGPTLSDRIRRSQSSLSPWPSGRDSFMARAWGRHGPESIG